MIRITLEYNKVTGAIVDAMGMTVGTFLNATGFEQEKPKNLEIIQDLTRSGIDPHAIIDMFKAKLF